MRGSGTTFRTAPLLVTGDTLTATADFTVDGSLRVAVVPDGMDTPPDELSLASSTALTGNATEARMPFLAVRGVGRSPRREGRGGRVRCAPRATDPAPDPLPRIPRPHLLPRTHPSSVRLHPALSVAHILPAPHQADLGGLIGQTVRLDVSMEGDGEVLLYTLGFE